jgi:hypothetical protein
MVNIFFVSSPYHQLLIFPSKISGICVKYFCEKEKLFSCTEIFYASRFNTLSKSLSIERGPELCRCAVDAVGSFTVFAHKIAHDRLCRGIVARIKKEPSSAIIDGKPIVLSRESNALPPCRNLQRRHALNRLNRKESFRDDNIYKVA